MDFSFENLVTERLDFVLLMAGELSKSILQCIN
jgi:hypothetical protein